MPPGRVIHRGYYDLAAANGDGVGRVCAALAARPGSGVALCEGAQAAPCDTATWAGTYPSSGCAGLDAGDLTSAGGSGPAFLPLGDGATLDLLAVNGVIDGRRYADEVGPLLTDDSNGENARSSVWLLRHGGLRLLLAGDLTGGGSDTDDVEGFLVPHLAAVSDLDSRGVDLLHLGHHGRDTSSSLPWLDALLPADGSSRNALIGISRGHVNSSHTVVLERLLASDRLTDGRGWTTRVAPLGAEHAELIDAGGGHVLVRSADGGRAYLVQAVDGDTVIWTRRYLSVRTCQP